MFGIGYQEMFIVLVVAMVIFGPSRLPELAGQVGRWVRDFRRMSSDLTGEFSSTFSEIDEVKKSFERELKSAAGELDNAGKSVSGKKPAAAKPATVAKSAAAGNKISTRSIGAKAGDTAAKSSATALDRGKLAKNGKTDGVALASKADHWPMSRFSKLILSRRRSARTVRFRWSRTTRWLACVGAAPPPRTRSAFRPDSAPRDACFSRTSGLPWRKSRQAVRLCPALIGCG